MGTRFEIVLEGRDSVHARAAGEAALACVAECDARFSRFRSDSMVSRIARAAREAPGEWVAIDGACCELLERAEGLRRASGGAFDVAQRPAGREGVDAGSATLELEPASRRARLLGRDAFVDLGAIAKGFALDLAAASLRESGVEVALMHGGTSSVIALGAPRGGWTISLGESFDGERLQLEQRALSVSAARQADGRAHLVDPASGATVEADMRVCVTAASATDADALSTALLVRAARGIPGEIPGFEYRARFAQPLHVALAHP